MSAFILPMSLQFMANSLRYLLIILALAAMSELAVAQSHECTSEIAQSQELSKSINNLQPQISKFSQNLDMQIRQLRLQLADISSGVATLESSTQPFQDSLNKIFTQTSNLKEMYNMINLSMMLILVMLGMLAVLLAVTFWQIKLVKSWGSHVDQSPSKNDSDVFLSPHHSGAHDEVEGGSAIRPPTFLGKENSVIERLRGGEVDSNTRLMQSSAQSVQSVVPPVDISEIVDAATKRAMNVLGKPIATAPHQSFTKSDSRF
jgi:predicted PurR-regulated permease PerM